MTSADGCRRVSVGVSVQKYSIQCKGYNLIKVTTVEVSSLYTGAVQGYWSTPNWSDRRQGCRQVSTAAYIQGLYKGSRVHPTGLTINQGCRQDSTELPRALASAGRRRGQRSNL